MKKVISLLLSLVLFVAVCGCAKNPGDEVSTPPPKFETTDITLAENGKSDYKIVLPLVYSYTEGYAAQELQDIFYEATGVRLPVISDNGLSLDNSGSYLSVGNTALLKAQTDIQADYGKQGESGVRIVTKNKTVYMIGATDKGTLNSVYQFLEHQVGFKAYAYDYTYVDYRPSVKLLQFDYTYRPTIDWSIAVEKKVALDDKAATRMYLYGDKTIGGTKYGGLGYSGGGTDLEGNQLFSLWCHESNSLVPNSGEAKENEYYKNGQYCYTRDGAYNLFKQKFIEKIMKSGESLAMIGCADNNGVCNCQECNEASEKYGGQGGVFMRFLNRLATDTEAYFTEHSIDRKLYIIGMAYHVYSVAPTVKDENGSIVPVDESVVAKKDGNVTVGVCYTPIGACYTHPLGNGLCEKNVATEDSFRGWSAITDTMMMYSYGTNFKYLTFPYNNWAFMAESFRYFKEMKVRLFYEQSDAWNGIGGPMAEMRTFVRASLSWDADRDMNDVTDDFMHKYYGPAADGVKRYFDRMQTQFNAIYATAGTSCQGCYYEIGKSEFWPRPVILELENILSDAMNAVEKSGLSANEKAAYRERVEREYILWKVNELTLYQNSLSGAELVALQKTVAEGRAKYDINRRAEHVID